MKPKNTESFSARKRIKSFSYAFSGLKGIILREHNFRIHLLAALIALILGFVLELKGGEWIALILVISLVLVTEILNSALEALSDIISPEYHESVKRAKDYSAAAVLVAAIASLVVGAFLFLPKFFSLLSA
jgi:diacylglycerol kinase (ATP)